MINPNQANPATTPEATNSSWRPGLVALDIDGTVVDWDGNLPPAVYDVVQRILAAEVPVVLSTGRAWEAVLPVFDALGLPPGLAVCSNGAVTVSYPPMAVHREVTFDASRVISTVTKMAPRALIAVEETGVGFRVSGVFPEGDLGGHSGVETLEELGSRPVCRVVVRDPHSSDEDFVQLAEHLGLHGITYSIGYSAWIDIAPDGVSKATALAEVAEHYGVAQADVLALGDGRNDVEMLAWAGRGVALGDAPDDVKQVADHVTGPFLEGGTTDELSRWFG